MAYSGQSTTTVQHALDSIKYKYTELEAKANKYREALINIGENWGCLCGLDIQEIVQQALKEEADE